MKALAKTNKKYSTTFFSRVTIYKLCVIEVLKIKKTYCRCRPIQKLVKTRFLLITDFWLTISVFFSKIFLENHSNVSSTKFGKYLGASLSISQANTTAMPTFGEKQDET